MEESRLEYRIALVWCGPVMSSMPGSLFKKVGENGVFTVEL